MVETWGGANKADPFTATDWASFSALDPLGRSSSGSNSYAMPKMYSFDQRQSASRGMDYLPAYGRYGSNYDPPSGFTSRVIDSDIQRWMQAEFPELYKFDTGNVNVGGGGGGDVSQNPAFGQFTKDPSVFSEIESAANKYGIPANLLKVMIARESSGDWQNNSSPVYFAPRGERIHGYVGIFESTAKSWGYNFDEMIGNRALQIDAMAYGLRHWYDQVGSQYGWDGVISVYYSGNPDQTYTPPDSIQHGTTAQYVSDVKSWWKQEDDWTVQNGGAIGKGGVVGLGNIDNKDWAPYNAQSEQINHTASQLGVPQNFVKAVYRANGDTPLDPNTTAAAIQANFHRTGSWETATKEYAAANGIDPNKYWLSVNSYWQELDASVSGRFGGETGDRGPVTTISAVWGNKPGVTTTQINGEVSGWTTGAGAGYYAYSTGVLGYPNAHPGNDYGMEYGSQIYSPVSGEVMVVGSGYYNDERQMGQPGTGELRIKLDNGDELIFGHMAGIHVSPGDRINAGQYVGLSGHAGSGPHLHLEYRIPDQAMSSGWRSINPEEALRGVFTTGFSGNQSGAGISRPMTFQELVKASASGKQIMGGLTVGSTNTWNSFLQSAMKGGIPNTRDESLSAMRGGDISKATGSFK